jgi:histidinol-phosphate aminotransferase
VDARLQALLRPETTALSTTTSPRVADAIRLDSNEAPPPRSPVIRDTALAAFGRIALERYPDPHATRLRDQVARRTGAKPEELVFGSGSDEVIALIAATFARPRGGQAKGVVLSPGPSFPQYRRLALIYGLAHVEVPLDDAWDLDVASMRAAIAETRPSIVYIASPNNPTSNAMDRSRLEAVIEAAEGTFVVVDEAYRAFAAPSPGGDNSVRRLRERHRNLGILGTLSKIGMAALRVGWLEADPAIVAEIDKVREPFNLSASSQEAAASVLELAWDEVQAHVRDVVQWRNDLAAAVASLPGYDVTPSSANFLWVRVAGSAIDVASELARRGILVRAFPQGGARLQAQLRITVGTPAENEALLGALRAIA